MINDFTSFDQVAKYMDTPIKNLEVVKKKSLREVGKHLRRTIRDRHGKYGPGWLKSNSSPASPLLRTGALRRAVSFRVSGDKVEVYSRKEWLALIHEYGVTYQMTDKQRRYLMGVVFKDKPLGRGRPRSNWGGGSVTIPPRPLWRILLNQKRRDIENIVDKNLNDIF